MEVSVQQYRYSGFFHYKNDADILPLVEFLRTFHKHCWTLEKVGMVNKDNQHIQWAIEDAKPWTKDYENLLTIKGSLGKHLVTKKVPCEGSKSAKRWSKIDAVRKNYSWESCKLYVFKHQEHKPDMNQLSDIYGELCSDNDWRSLIGVFNDAGASHQRFLRPKKTKNFSEQLVELYESNGCPETKREIFEMLLRHFMLNKWNYISRSQVYKAAEYLYLRRHTDSVVAEYLEWFDKHEEGTHEFTD